MAELVRPAPQFIAGFGETFLLDSRRRQQGGNNSAGNQSDHPDQPWVALDQFSELTAGAFGHIAGVAGITRVTTGAAEDGGPGITDRAKGVSRGPGSLMH